MNQDIEPSQPWVVLLWGAPAAGKTTIANRFVEHWYRVGVTVGHLGTDRFNHVAFGGHFDGTVRAGLYQGMFTMVEEFLKVGRPLLVEGTFLDLAQRQRMAQLCRRWGARYLSVCVECPLNARLWRNRMRPVTDRVPEDWLRRAHGLAQAEADLRLDTYKRSPESALEQLLSKLRTASVAT